MRTVKEVVVLAEVGMFVRQSASRMANLGQWPAYMNPPEKGLLMRIPEEDGGEAPGFDAGIACALDLIPRDKQRLACILHAAYTPAAVQQVRKEILDLQPDSETAWWAAMSSICREGKVDVTAFWEQISQAVEMHLDPELRLQAARAFLLGLGDLYGLHIVGNTTEGGGGVPIVAPLGHEDGCLQGAYLDGFQWAVYYSGKYGLYFVGTYLETLGLEEFQWAGGAKSGPVHGRQFVKCQDADELARVVRVVQTHFSNIEARAEIERLRASKNQAYHERNRLVVALAKICDYGDGPRGHERVHVADHGDDPNWARDWRHVLFIQTADYGQFSWHFRDSEVDLLKSFQKGENTWDGHTTEDKYSRLLKWAGVDDE
jgi:hypothetical protein